MKSDCDEEHTAVDELSEKLLQSEVGAKVEGCAFQAAQGEEEHFSAFSFRMIEEMNAEAWYPQDIVVHNVAVVKKGAVMCGAWDRYATIFRRIDRDFVRYV